MPSFDPKKSQCIKHLKFEISSLKDAYDSIQSSAIYSHSDVKKLKDRIESANRVSTKWRKLCLKRKKVINDLQDKFKNQPIKKLGLEVKTKKTKIGQCKREIRQANGHYMNDQLDKKTNLALFSSTKSKV